ncbi:uncharacterized protein DUF397 [Saccharothrix carnea]|uniref:Uncharacterized protein DUF397 n=1 Tax=Saccharothrix carnea TaxID=1280637 RepID=A0A2P8IJH7_SACCR|nr:DUF397 domain-containing protein [Saccharothrix carnea]PSL58615.1 uncharacterized protein DUF397 [Saccharothrix carnea]
MSVVDPTGLVWRTSSCSGDADNDNCVEVAFSGPAVGVRDSKSPEAGVVAFSASAWQRFLRS